MKNYINYIFEAASSPDFNKDYESVLDKLNVFYTHLEISLESLEKINLRNPDKVAKKNAKLRGGGAPPPPPPPKATPPEKMKNGVLIHYNFETAAGKIMEVTIDTPDNGQNTNTALVIDVKNPSKGTFTANWSKLKPLAIQPKPVPPKPKPPKPKPVPPKPNPVPPTS